VITSNVRILKAAEGARPVLVGFARPRRLAHALPALLVLVSFRLPSSTWISPPLKCAKPMHRPDIRSTSKAVDHRGRGRMLKSVCNNRIAEIVGLSAETTSSVRSDQSALGTEGCLGAIGRISDTTA
jgi:hypothetical protein